MPLPSSGVDLAVRAGATLVPVFLVREEDGYVLRVHPPLAPGEDPLPGFARALERELARHAAQWCFLYPAREPHPVESALDPMTGAAGPRADRASASTTELTSMPEACA
jgi:hypothetical protein